MSGLKRLEHHYHKFKKELRIILNKYPYRVQCNVCGWKGRIFDSDSWHLYIICPRCRSQVRHRLAFAALNLIPNLKTEKIIQGKRVLHFAPERVISQYIIPRAANYVTADVFRNDVDMRLDISNMNTIKDKSFDLVIAFDILEHVADDSRALQEIHRILSEYGWVILTIPQKDDLLTTYQDQSVTTPEGREKAFGQRDHLRIYGNDFGHLIETHGFNITTIDERDFNPIMVKKNVLFPPVLSNHPLANNHRKVFFGQKVLE